MTSELLVAGAANLDRMMYVERIPEQGETIMALNYEEHPGGKGANQAVAAALWGMKVNFIGRTGDDEPGKIIKNSLENDKFLFRDTRQFDYRSGRNQAQ